MNRTQQSTAIAICLLGLAVLALGAVFLVREWREEVVERQRLQEENEQLRMEVEQLTVKRIISNRLNRYGVKEISIATQGEDRIIVQVPGADNADEIIRQIEESGNLEFMLVAPDGLEGSLATLRPAVDQYNEENRVWVRDGKKGPAPARPEALQKVYDDKQTYMDALKVYAALTDEEQLRTVPPKAPQWVVYPQVLERGDLVDDEAETFEEDLSSYTILHFDPKYRVSGEHLTGAREVLDEGGNPAIGFDFDGRGGAKFGEITGSHIDWGLAIQLDGTLISVANIQSKITNSGRITGGRRGFTHKQVEGVVNLLLGGSLPSKPQLVSKTQVGSMLSADSIKNGMTAIIYGLIIVMTVMLAYYMVGGLVANLAVILNLTFIYAYVLVFRQTITLPGIAGVILTIGMAVDANILIFERVREELLKGKALVAALGTGYQRAFWVIFDSNVTTLVTGLVLVQFGTGPVKGFAVTLIAGIIASFFTSVFVTRLILSYLINVNILKSFKMFRLIGVPRVDFQRYKKTFVMLSVLTILVSWSFVLWGDVRTTGSISTVGPSSSSGSPDRSTGRTWRSGSRKSVSRAQSSRTSSAPSPSRRCDSRGMPESRGKRAVSRSWCGVEYRTGMEPGERRKRRFLPRTRRRAKLAIPSSPRSPSVLCGLPSARSSESGSVSRKC